MQKGIIAYAGILVLLIVLWYVYADFAIPFSSTTTTTTIAGGNHTGIPETKYSCMGLYATLQSFNSTSEQYCTWEGGNLGIWAASGGAAYVQETVTGQDGVVYSNKTFTNPCVAFDNVYNLPAQEYSVSVTSGPRNMSHAKGACGYTGMNINSLPNQYNTTFNMVVNGNFLTGTYYGWTATGPAFGLFPLNLTNANANGCYPYGQEWLGYNGTYAASTYQCNLKSNSTGNITSSRFIANKAFLNFQVLGSGGIFSYVEITYANRTAIKAYFNTNMASGNRTGEFTFANATIPMLTVKGKPVQIRIVVKEQNSIDYLLVGNFRMSDTAAPMRTGVLVNLSYG